MMPFDAFEENSRGRRKGERSGADCFEFVNQINSKKYEIYTKKYSYVSSN